MEKIDNSAPINADRELRWAGGAASVAAVVFLAIGGAPGFDPYSLVGIVLAVTGAGLHLTARAVSRLERAGSRR